MRNKRAKTYRKLLASYVRHFGLRAPLQVLLDAPMTTSLASMKLSVGDTFTRLEDALQVSAALPSSARPQSMHANAAAAAAAASSAASAKANRAAAFVKPMITQCVITELYKAQKDGEVEMRAVELAKGWERRFCNHREAIPGDRCMRDVIGDTNKHRYVLAANSAALRATIRREVAGVPVVHVNDHKVLVMEPMSDLTRKRCEELERQKMNALAGTSKSGSVLGKRRGNGEEGEETEANVIASGEGAEEPVQPAIKRKKKAKGPNPLSMKKSKKDKAQASGKKKPNKSKPKPMT